MKVKDLIETCCDEDELFVIQDYEDEVVKKIWLSEYRMNKDKYKEVFFEVESWSGEIDKIIIWIK